MEVYTIGFTKKSAREFFGILRGANIGTLVDVRLNNVSQLAGFTKASDLEYFLGEIGGIRYVHEPLLAPTQEMLSAYKMKKVVPWEDYERDFLALMGQRRIEAALDQNLFRDPTVLLCSEPTAEKCHRRLVLQYLAGYWPDLRTIHL